MKRNIIVSVAFAAFAFMASSFSPVKSDSPTAAQGEAMVTVTTGAQGEIVNVSGQGFDNNAWHIRDLSGYTNIRNKPSSKGAVCMRLKANTQYNIYANGSSGGWLHISKIYNIKEGYWVRLHSSSTGTYWIAKSILF